MNVVHGRPARIIAASLLLLLTTTVAHAAPPSCHGERATKVGTAGDDEMIGTKGRDVIVGLGGNDFIESKGGSDIVCGGAGNDSLYGGPEKDILVAGGGSNDLIGGGGSDLLMGGSGDSYIVGNAGNDVIKGGSGFDFADFRYAKGPVRVDLAAKRATGEGTDKVTNLEMISGTTGDDELLGSSAEFEIYVGLGGDDVIDGRSGFDQMIFQDSPVGVTADIAAGTASGEGNDTLVSIESLSGSDFDDVLLGHDQSDDLYGQGGNDTIDGRGGNDYLLGHAGNDEISGGPGRFDMIDFDPGAPAVNVNMATGVSTGEGTDQVSGLEIIGGSEFNDTLVGDDSDNLFYSYAGDDSIDGRGGEDLVLYNVAMASITADLVAGVATGEGRDTLTAIEGFVGSNFNDSLSGDAQENVLIGGPGDDDLSGGEGDDYFEGGEGDDAIVGGGGTFDMANYLSAPGGVTASLQTKTASGEGQDSLDGIEALLGSPLEDSLTGDAGDNYLLGGGGDDDLSGGAGDDELDGADGADSLDGGPGTDDCLAGETVTACEGQNQSSEAAEAENRQQALSELGGVLDGQEEKRAH